jgi:hypothetical protein
MRREAVLNPSLEIRALAAVRSCFSLALAIGRKTRVFNSSLDSGCSREAHGVLLIRCMKG